MNKASLQPALLGGLFIGVMSGLPFISIGNFCCCMWVIAGGVLAVYLRQQHDAAPLTSAEGALLGMIAGVIGAIIGTIISIPVQMLMGPLMQQWIDRFMSSNQDLPPEFRDMMSRFGGMRAAFAFVGMLISICVDAVFGLIGGLLGVAIFNRNTPPPPAGPITGGPTYPPPPPTVTPIPYDPGVAQ